MKKMLYFLSIVLPAVLIFNVSTADAQRKNSTEKDVKTVAETTNADVSNHKSHKEMKKEMKKMKKKGDCKCKKKSADCDCDKKMKNKKKH